MPLPGATVTVYQEGTTTPLADAIYADSVGGATLANPVTADADGVVEFFLEVNRRVDLRVVKAGYATQTVTEDVVGDTVMADAGAQVFNVVAYGATGDGIADDTTTLQAAIDAASAAGGGIVFVPTGTYRFSALVLKANVWLRGAGRGSVLKPFGAGAGAVQITAWGTSTGAYTLLAAAAEGATSVTLGAGQGANFAAGDLLLIYCTGGYVPGQACRVEAVAGDVLTLGEPLYNAFPTALTAVNKCAPIRGVRVSDLAIDYGSVTGLNTRGLSIRYALQPVVQNVDFLNSGANADGVLITTGGAGLELLYCLEPQVDGARFEVCGTQGMAALYLGVVTGGWFSRMVFHHGGFHIQAESTCACAFDDVRSTYAGWKVLGGRAFKLQLSSSYNAGANVVLSRAHSNGLGFVQGCHHNVFAGVVSTGHRSAEGVWFEGEGSHHNTVRGTFRHNATFDVGFYAGTDTYNYVEGDFDATKVLAGQPTSRAVDVTEGPSRPVAANLLVNPGFEVWQRGAGPFTATTAYAADRWQIVLAGSSTLSVSRDAANADTGSLYCAACAYVHNAVSVLTQKLEDYPGLRGRVLALSVRVKTSTANAVRIGVYDSVNGYRYSAYHTGSGAYETLAVAANIDAATTQVLVSAEFAASCTAYLDNATLVADGVPAAHAPLHPADDLARCQRYYWELGGLLTTDPIGVGVATGATTMVGAVVHFPVEMGGAPTVTVSAAADFGLLSASGAGIVCATLTSPVVEKRTARLDATVAAGLTAGHACFLRAQSTTNARITFVWNP